MSPWLTAKSWWIQQPHLVSDFWEERILQLGVVGCAHFFLWNLWEEPMYTAVIDTHEEYEIMSAMLSQLFSAFDTMSELAGRLRERTRARVRSAAW